MKTPIKQSVIQLVRKIGYEIVPTSRVMPRAISAHLRALFPILNISCVLDVGANVGQFRDMLREEVGYDGLIVSFEPTRKAAHLLQQRSGGDPRWVVYDCALGAKDMVRRLNVMSADTLSSFLEPDSSGATGLFAQHNVVDHAEEVSIRTLDSVLEELRAAGRLSGGVFLKMDTQGFDLEVLKGAEKSLGGIAGVQTELACQRLYRDMPGYVDMLTALDARGFQMSGMFPVNQDTLLRIIEMDCVMINNAAVKNADARLMWTNGGV